MKSRSAITVIVLTVFVCSLLLTLQLTGHFDQLVSILIEIALLLIGVIGMTGALIINALEQIAAARQYPRR